MGLGPMARELRSPAPGRHTHRHRSHEYMRTGDTRRARWHPAPRHLPGETARRQREHPSQEPPPSPSPGIPGEGTKPGEGNELRLPERVEKILFRCNIHCTSMYHPPMKLTKDLMAASAAPLVLAILSEGESY